MFRSTHVLRASRASVIEQLERRSLLSAYTLIDLGGPFSAANDINEAGQIVGSANVGGQTHAGALYHENLRSLLRFAAKHHGPAEAERTRRMLVRALRLRGAVFPGERGAAYADAARWLASAPAERFLQSSP